MTLADLNRTLQAAVATGRIGTPVSLTLHAQYADASTELSAALASLVPLAEGLFGGPPARLAGRASPDESQWNLLFSFPRGETAVVTLGRGASPHGSLQLLAVGNQGVIRLEGDEPLEPMPATGAAAAAHAHSRVLAALASAEAVEW